MSIWNPENIKDVAESVGIAGLHDDVVNNLARDVEYRVSQVLEEAIKFMRHSKRTTLSTSDVSQALRALNVEPLYGYDSTRPLRFGEASIGPGQPLFYVEDEEVDFEKLINAPLPKVPREVSFTAHWLAVEGVQPSIPQNPTSADTRNQELLPKGVGAAANLAAFSGNDNVQVKPLVKHILSKELQVYFETVCSAVLDKDNEDSCVAALSSLRGDPGLHQLVPYFVQFIAEKVTHNLRNLFVLTQMMHLTSAMLDNESLYIDPYVASVVPPVLTCVIGRHLGDASAPNAHYALRDLASSLISTICKKYAKSSRTLKPRLARTFLKGFLDPDKSLVVHYGSILGIQAVGGVDAIRVLLLPNLKVYEDVIREDLSDDGPRKTDAEMVLTAIIKALSTLEGEFMPATDEPSSTGDEAKAKLTEKLGNVIGTRVTELRRPRLVSSILDESSTLSGL
ncbi:MAG: cytochrome b subunit of succinate dehydrogenase, Sdh3p [Chaenotheca gracillima]|nr:MAG: cytochrome b subunit of succinate dehydrogenase, Sdh3p [Chaenotheca gracillima]